MRTRKLSPSPHRTVEYANFRVDGHRVLIAKDSDGNRVRELVLRPDVDEERARRAFWLALDCIDPVPEIRLLPPSPQTPDAQRRTPEPPPAYSVGVALMLARRRFPTDPAS